MILGLWADPRGAYAILALLLLGVLGAAIAPGGLSDKPRRTRRLIAAAVLLGAALALLWPQFAARHAIDVNPVMPAVAQLAGPWSDGSDTLQLRTDGTYACRGRYRRALVPPAGSGATCEGRLMFEKAAP